MEEDLSCPICFRLLYNASALQCGHSFCKPCIEKSFESTSCCPVCRKSFPGPLALSPSYILNNLIKKTYPDLIKSREAEEVQKSTQQKVQNKIPVIFLFDFICLPEERFCVVIVPEKYRIFLRTLNEEKNEFVISSDLSKLRIFLMCKLIRLVDKENESVVFGKCLFRMSPTYIERVNHPSYVINISEIGDAEVFNSSLFQAPVVEFQDRKVQVDKELETRLVNFSQKCMDLLTVNEISVAEKRRAHTMIMSFNMLSLFKISNKEMIRSFLSDDENYRLRIMENHIKGKVPSRALMRYSKSVSFPWMYATVWVLLLVYFLTSQKSFKTLTPDDFIS